jgi:dTDP-4-dehydrorhamnose reductase
MSKKTVSIIGATGLLGREVLSRLRRHTDWQVVGSGVNDVGKVDITSDDAIQKHFELYHPDIVINCSAFSNVDACETPEGFEVAKEVNGYGVGRLARYCETYQATFLHISTDYVFGDNSETGYDEYYDKYTPLNSYGRTKQIGEQEVIRIAGGTVNSSFVNQDLQFYIVRISWLFGDGAGNFMSKIIHAARIRDSISVVVDEVGSPTYTKDVAMALIHILQHRLPGGIYHASGHGSCSRYEFAKEILSAKAIHTNVLPTTMDQFPRKAKVPHYSFLLNTKLPQMRDWREMVRDFLAHS